ncbi:MAG TPA: ABC transporter permease [Silvibacterium sp.]|nr:ABC transporter permease [Silvibacterium sp.]
MNWLKRIYSATLGRRRSLYNDLSEEMLQHLEEKTAELQREGLSRQQAEQSARRAFGNPALLEQRSREVWQWPRLETFWADLKFALRQLRKSPAFTLTTALVLTLGIGVNTAIFSIVQHVVLEPLPFPHPDRLQAVWARSSIQRDDRIAASGPDFVDYQDQNRSFSQIAAVLPDFTFTWTGEGDPKLVMCTSVSQDFFPMFGIHPYMGRFYTAHEYTYLENDTLVVSYKFWKTQLAGDPHVIGRVVHFEGVPETIIGVTAPMPDLFPETDVWPKHTTRPSWDYMKWRNNKFLTVIGRLKPGVTPAMAQEDLTAILRRAPGEPSDVQVQLTPLKEDLVGKVRTQLELILLSVAVVLLVACINIAALLLARSVRRSGEMALRLSLGAGRRRLRQQLLIEGLVLGACGSIPGVLVALLALRLLPHLQGLDLPRLGGIHLSIPALLVTLSIAAATMLTFALISSSRFSSLNIALFLRTSQTDTGGSQRRIFSSLVIAEIACSLVLSVCAGFLLHSYWKLSRVDPGFRPDHMLTTYLRTDYYTPEGRSFWKNVLEGVSTLPGVRQAALADCTPGEGAAIATLVFGDRANDPNHAAPAEGCWASAGFFRTSGTPLLRGRSFNAADNADSPPVVIINEQAARMYWPGENPIGKLIGVNYTGPGRVGNSKPRLRQVVGVVQGMKHGNLDLPTGPAVYMPYLQDETYHDMATMSLFVRSAADPRSLADSIRARIHSVKPDQPVDEIQTMQEIMSRSLAPRRYSLSLLGAFAALGLLLSAVGIYGIVSYTTLQRTREFGIRIAVGATRTSVVALVFRQGLVLALAGSLIGVVAATLLTGALSRLLFQVSPLDAVSFISAVFLVGVISAVASLTPALRAASVNPVEALRAE